MLDAKHIQQLKQSDISKNAEKTKERVGRIWKAATAEQKSTVLELAGVISATVYRIYRTGSISAKLTVSLAQVFNLSPLYFTGATDNLGECSDTTLRKLLLELGYKKLVADANLKRAYHRKNPTADATPVAPILESDGVDINPEATTLLFVQQTQQVPPDCGALVETDYQVLFQALHIQLKAGIPTAREKLAQIYAILLS